MTKVIEYQLERIGLLLDAELDGDLTPKQLRDLLHIATDCVVAKAEAWILKRRLAQCEKALRMLYTNARKASREFLLIPPVKLKHGIKRAKEYFNEI